jgi:hypothetical protein
MEDSLRTQLIGEQTGLTEWTRLATEARPISSGLHQDLVDMKL